jgi:hypothetical protein
MVDGSASIRRAVNIGTVSGSRLRIDNGVGSEEFLTARERADWFRFRATGRLTNSLFGTVTHSGTIAEENTDEDAISGITATTQMTVFFQRQGSKEIRRLGVLRGLGDRLNGVNTTLPGRRQIFPKGEGTYYIKVSRAGNRAFTGNIRYNFSFEFVPSLLSTDDSPPESNGFFF